MKVVKFGGSSLASAEQFIKAGDIINSDKERRFVVPSAPGKRSKKDTKVTDIDVYKRQDCAVLLHAVMEKLDRDPYHFYVGTSYRHCLIWQNG